MQELFFPFDKIKQGSRVVLYGGGSNARILWEMNEKTKWCNIIFCVDMNYGNINNFPCKIYDPKDGLSSQEYDYVLISLLDEHIRKQVVEYLIEIGINKSKIVNAFLHTEKTIVYSSMESNFSEHIRIGFHPMGVIGDTIISLKVYQELVRLSEEKCIIDVLNEYNAGFMDSIFYGQKCLGKIINGNGNITEDDIKQYDLVIDVRFEPSVSGCNLEKLKTITPLLSDRINRLIKYQETDYLDLPIYQYANRVLLDRAEYLGLNRYTLLGISGAFDIKDTKVEFYIDEQYEEQYNNLHLDKPFITYNYGANDQYKDGRKQTKMWPFEYHELLNKYIKEKYPDIEVIQLGSNNVEKVPGADRYILGQPLDVVKYILKNSMLHIDCEGGLVHMASQLGTKCFTLFGPTPAWFLGYENNTNICSKRCGNCKGLTKDWYVRCLKYDKPECMYSIKAEEVFELIDQYIKANCTGI